MFRIERFICSEDVGLKLQAKHGIKIEEIESANGEGPIFLRRGDLYVMLGKTGAGRRLFVLLRYLGGNVARIITAHEMTDREKHVFRRMGG